MCLRRIISITCQCHTLPEHPAHTPPWIWIEDREMLVEKIFKRSSISGTNDQIGTYYRPGSQLHTSTLSIIFDIPHAKPSICTEWPIFGREKSMTILPILLKFSKTTNLLGLLGQRERRNLSFFVFA